MHVFCESCGLPDHDDYEKLGQTIRVKVDWLVSAQVDRGIAPS